uniref:Uncharacterized protein n=1 Tax=Arundo donax TaxID=35708 RepID=A0A0A9DJP8_ARUDO
MEEPPRAKATMDTPQRIPSPPPLLQEPQSSPSPPPLPKEPQPLRSRLPFPHEQQPVVAVVPNVSQRWLLSPLCLPSKRKKLIKMKIPASRKLINTRILHLRFLICSTKARQCFHASSPHLPRPLVPIAAALPVVQAAVFPTQSRHLQQLPPLPVCLHQPQQAPLPRRDHCLIFSVLIPPFFALRLVRPPLCSHRLTQATPAPSLHLQHRTCPRPLSCRRLLRLELHNQTHRS